MENLKQKRLDLGLSQQELADALGTEQQRVSEWETGEHNPSPAYRRLLEIELDIEWEEDDA